MKKRFYGIIVMCVFCLGFVLFPGKVFAAYQVSTFSELTMAYEQIEADFFALGGLSPVMATINGVEIEYFVETALGLTYIYDLTNMVVIYEGPINDAFELEALRLYFGIPILSAGSIGTPAAAAATMSNLVFENLVVPSVVPKTEQKNKESQKQMGAARVFGGRISVDWVDVGDGAEEGNIYNFSIGVAQDFDNYTFGVIIPYDRLNFDSFDANRVGIMPYAQYHLELTDELKTTLSANLNYMYSDFDFDGGGNEKIDTYGGGLSTGLQYVQEKFELGCGVSWQYNKDDVDMEDDHQHLIKVGSNVGLHVTDEQVVNLFGVWNKDVTDYEADFGDDNYFDLGVEYRANFSGTWMFNVGYKKVVDLDDYDSDMIYIGSNFMF